MRYEKLMNDDYATKRKYFLDFIIESYMLSRSFNRKELVDYISAYDNLSIINSNFMLFVDLFKEAVCFHKKTGNLYEDLTVQEAFELVIKYASDTPTLKKHMDSLPIEGL